MSYEIILDEINPLAEGEILAESIRQWRSDCQAGQFKIGSTTMKGHKLDMELVGANISEGEYFGYPFQKWLGLLFIDAEGVLSSIMFKTESLDQFEELRRTYRLKGETLLGKTIRASMSRRASRANGNGYYAVEFDVISNGKYAEAIKEFRQVHYSPQLFRQLGSEHSGTTTALPAPVAITAPTTTPALLPEKVVESSEETIHVDAATVARTVNRKKAPQAQSMVH